MKKIYLIISIVFLCNTSGIAQKIDQNEFNKLVDFVSCIYAKQYCEKISKNTSESDAYDQIIAPILNDNCDIEKHLSSDSLYKLFKSANKQWNKTADELIKFRQNNKKCSDVSNKSDIEIIDYIVKIEGTYKTVIDKDNFINNIKTVLINKYSDQSTVNPLSAVNITLKQQIEGLIGDVSSRMSKIESIQKIYSVLLLCCFLVCAFTLLKTRKIKDLENTKESIHQKPQKLPQDEETKNYIIKVFNDQRNAQEFNLSAKSGNDTAALIRQLQGQVDSLNKHITGINAAIENLQKNQYKDEENSTVITITNEITEKNNSETKKHLYLKDRQGMMLFKEVTKENAHYELDINGNERVGDKVPYRFCGIAKRAIAYYNGVLEDVFDDEKSYFLKATRIENIEDGVVEFQTDGKWKVITPAKIEFS